MPSLYSAPLLARHFAAIAIAIVVTLGSISTSLAATYIETRVATRFLVFAPPNNDQNKRYSAIVVTALSGTAANPCVVDLIDDDGDGDADDTVLKQPLTAGQSLIRYLKDGAINDDYGGKWDGDLFDVRSSQPVTVMLVTDSDWQHDWAPSDNGTSRGNRFLLYANRTTVSARDINVFAYEKDTRVTLRRISSGALTSSGVTTLAATVYDPLLTVDLTEGEDLNIRNKLGFDLLEAGHTYELTATKPVTVLYGAIGGVTATSGSRDGAGFVPGRSGSSVDDDFYFNIPHKASKPEEKELRVVSFDNGVEVTLRGWDVDTESWVQVTSWSLDAFDHADQVGGKYDLYRLQSTGGKVVVYEANWMETGSIGTSDESDFVPTRFGPNGSASWLVYLGPPGTQSATSIANGAYTHVYLSSLLGASDVRIRDADTNGKVIDVKITVPVGGMFDFAIDSATYNSLNQPKSGKRPYLLIESPSPLSANMTNWNDNWMAFATAVVTRNPELTLEAPETFAVGKSAVISGTVENQGGASILEVTVRVETSAGVRIADAALGGVKAKSLVHTSTGSVATFVVGKLGAGESKKWTADLAIESGTSGALSPVSVIATATSSDVQIASVTSSPVLFEDPGVATLSALHASGGDGTIDVTWSADASAVKDTTTMSVQRSANASGPWTTVDTQTVKAETKLSLFKFSDTKVANGSNWYYRVYATGSGLAKASIGPVLGSAVDVTPPPKPVIVAAAGNASVTLQVGGSSSASDLVGYRIQHSKDGLAGWNSLTSDSFLGPTHIHSGLTNGTPSYYRVQAVDDASNVSTSTVVTATPAAPSALTTDDVLRFEDMLGKGENDWDYNDWIVRVRSMVEVGGGGVQRVVIDYEPLARGAGYIHSMRQRLALKGAWLATVTVFAANKPTLVVSTTTTSGSGILDKAIWANTQKALPPQVGSFSNTSPKQAHWLAGQTARLEVTLVSATSTSTSSLGKGPFDAYLRLPYLPAANNEIHRSIYAGPVEVTQAIGPLQGRALPFVTETPTAVDPKWSFEGEPVWLSFPTFVAHTMSPSASTQMWSQSPTAKSAVFARSR